MPKFSKAKLVQRNPSDSVFALLVRAISVETVLYSLVFFLVVLICSVNVDHSFAEDKRLFLNDPEARCLPNKYGYLKNDDWRQFNLFFWLA